MKRRHNSGDQIDYTFYLYKQTERDPIEGKDHAYFPCHIVKSLPGNKVLIKFLHDSVPFPVLSETKIHKDSIAEPLVVDRKTLKKFVHAEPDYHVGDKVYVAWQEFIGYTIGLWDATITKIKDDKIFIDWTFKQDGYIQSQWITARNIICFE